MRMELTDQEATDLRELLRASLSDLSVEIAATDNPGYREGLRSRRASFEAVLLQLGGENAQVAQA